MVHYYVFINLHLSFIRLGGGKTAASLHLVRAVFRRLQPSLPQLVKKQK
jgi:cob(I)alamin adenosyltransferase